METLGQNFLYIWPAPSCGLLGALHYFCILNKIKTGFIPFFKKIKLILFISGEAGKDGLEPLDQGFLNFLHYTFFLV